MGGLLGTADDLVKRSRATGRNKTQRVKSYFLDSFGSVLASEEVVYTYRARVMGLPHNRIEESRITSTARKRNRGNLVGNVTKSRGAICLLLELRFCRLGRRKTRKYER